MIFGLYSTNSLERKRRAQHSALPFRSYSKTCLITQPAQLFELPETVIIFQKTKQITLYKRKREKLPVIYVHRVGEINTKPLPLNKLTHMRARPRNLHEELSFRMIINWYRAKTKTPFSRLLIAESLICPYLRLTFFG